jgi:hypothetical protein
MASSRHQAGGTSGQSSRTKSPLSTFYLCALDTYNAEVGKATEQNIHGGLLSLSTLDILDSGNNINVTTGVGKLMFVLNAGSDVTGTITVTGTSVDRETGAETASDTDDIVVDALTTDGSGTDANGNGVHAFTGAYITSKWFKGAVVVSTADTTFTDVDTYHCSFEQVDDTPQFVLDTFDINVKAITGSDTLDAYLYALAVTGSKVDITREADLNSGATTAAKYYRLRRGNIGKALSGTTDGFFVDVFAATPNRFEDLTMKVWVKVIGTATDITLVGTDRVAGPSSSTDNAVVRWDGTDGDTVQNSTVTITDAGVTTIDDGSGNTIVLTTSAVSPSLSMLGSIVLQYTDVAKFLALATAGITVGFPNSATKAPMSVTERSAAPSSPAANDIYLDDGTNTGSGNPGWRRYTGAAWEDITAAAGGGGGDVTAAANMTDQTIVRGDGGAKGVEDTGWTIDDSDDQLAPGDAKIQFRDSAIFIHSAVDGDLLIQADDTVTIESTGEVVRQKYSGHQVAEIVSTFDVDNSSDAAAHVTKEDGGSTPNERYRVISFDDSTDEHQDFLIRVYDGYDGSSGVTVRLPWSAESAVVNDVKWDAAFRRLNFDGEDVDTSHSYSYQTTTDTAPGTQGHITQATITFTNAQADGVQPGELAILRIRRDANDVADDMSNDAYLWPAVQVVLT